MMFRKYGRCNVGLVRRPLESRFIQIYFCKSWARRPSRSRVVDPWHERPAMTDCQYQWQRNALNWREHKWTHWSSWYWAKGQLSSYNWSANRFSPRALCSWSWDHVSLSGSCRMRSTIYILRVATGCLSGAPNCWLDSLPPLQQWSDSKAASAQHVLKTMKYSDSHLIHFGPGQTVLCQAIKNEPSRMSFVARINFFWMSKRTHSIQLFLREGGSTIRIDRLCTIYQSTFSQELS